MNFADILLLFGAGILAGGINAVAGGGTFITFPALIFTGMPAIYANATSTVAVWPGSLASARAYRKLLPLDRRALIHLSLISAIGGGVGALILLLTPETTFRRMIPWLLLTATLIFAFGGAGGRGQGSKWRPPFLPPDARSPASYILQFGIAVYGGYFGAGIGILMLAMLQLMGLSHIHRMNAVKTVLGSVINGVAVVTFVAAGIVVWPAALATMSGAILGGYAGALAAQRVSPAPVRGFVIVTGVFLTAYFFYAA